MAKRPYFTITEDSFEKNAGYKSTVHALAELIDNAFEAEASNVAIVLQVDSMSQLQQIAVIDDGNGMDADILQMAICEKAGAYMERQRQSGSSTRRKLGKYGVGLPKASISQCNRLTVWSWVEGGYEEAYRNSFDINDIEWIQDGAQIDDSINDPAPIKWLKVADLHSAGHGTMVLWKDLDGLTWTRARWGQYSGLIPNLEFEVGRVYRKLLTDQNYEFNIIAIVIDKSFKVEETYPIKCNDPLYLYEGQNIPKKKLSDDEVWPPDDPLFDEICDESMDIELPLKSGEIKEVTVKWRCSAARKNAFALLNGRTAGSLPHGKHALRNVGLSLLREGREVSMSIALANPSEPRERWFGVEVELPHELDSILGMTNNKQEYTRLERVLKHEPKEYMENGETSSSCLQRIEREDNNLAICLRIAWQTQVLWNNTKRSHLNMREENKRLITYGEEVEVQEEETATDPEGIAEEAASFADPTDTAKPKTEEESDSIKKEFENELKGAGVPENEAKQIAARIVDRGLSYAIAHRGGLGSPFFNVTNIKGIKFIELNTDHPAHKYIKSSFEEVDSDDIEELKRHIGSSKIAVHLMLGAWAKNEVAVLIDKEKRRLHRIREDWGRTLELFIEQLERDEHLE